MSTLVPIFLVWSPVTSHDGQHLEGKDMTPVKTPMYDNNFPVLGFRAGKRDNENAVLQYD